MSALTESELAREARKILRKLLAGAHLELCENGRYGVVARARAARYAKTKLDASLAAAKRVDPAKDDDIEDLYLVVVGLEVGGDHAAAEAVRRVMRRQGGVHIARAIMLRWLDLDANAPRPRGLTPWHAGPR